MQDLICLPWTVKMPIGAIKIFCKKIFEDNKQQEIMTK